MHKLPSSQFQDASMHDDRWIADTEYGDDHCDVLDFNRRLKGLKVHTLKGRPPSISTSCSINISLLRDAWKGPIKYWELDELA